ncbi:hypothetical protein ABPG75_009391 [Micractinium tetrahymenae]
MDDHRDVERSPGGGGGGGRRSRSLSRERLQSRSPDRRRDGSRSRSRERRRAGSRSRSRDRRRSRSRSRDRRRASRSPSRDRRRRSPSRDCYRRSRSRSRSRGRRDSPPRRVGGRSSPPPERGTQLFIAGIPFMFMDRDLYDKLDRYGRVKQARIVRNPANGESRGFGFVDMADEEGAALAIRKLDGSDWNGRRLQVEVAKRPRNL